MIRILVNTPKGGVGKTTLATNIAINLAKKNMKVWAIDLAQGGLMNSFLINHPNFLNVQNKVEIREAESLPNSFPGASNFDVMVIDTDDYFKILSDLIREEHRGKWKVIVPIVNEYNGLFRIPRELASVLKASLFVTTNIDITAVVNKFNNLDDYDNVLNALHKEGIGGILSKNVITTSNGSAPYFEDDNNFINEINILINDLGV